MTCYLHIGMPKTGTTSIQQFLKLNYDILLEKQYLFPISTLLNGNHYPLVKILFSTSNKKVIKYNYNLKKIIYNQNHKEKNKYILNKYISEIKKYTNIANIIFSCENFTIDITDRKEIIKLHKIFQLMGIKNVKIIIYLRSLTEFLTSWYSQDIKHGAYNPDYLDNIGKEEISHMCNYKHLIEMFCEVFGKDNIIVKKFEKKYFFQEDLLKDFVHTLGLDWDQRFVIPKKQNESLNLFSMEILKALNRITPRFLPNFTLNPKRVEMQSLIQDKFYSLNKNEEFKFQLPIKTIKLYEDHFKDSQEWVRKEFFPHEKSLFPEKDLIHYKENYEIKEMKPEYWNKIAEFIADLLETKNKIIKDKDNIIQDKISQIQILNQAIQVKDIIIFSKNNFIFFQAKYSTAKSRIQNQLSYKLGQAMIVNSKSILGYIRMPFVLSYIKDKHKQEQKIHQEKIKKDPSLKLPPLESYPDYKEALKEKECLTYKLGEALIKANKTWYKGGYLKFYFKDMPKLKRDFRQKR